MEVQKANIQMTEVVLGLASYVRQPAFCQEETCPQKSVEAYLKIESHLNHYTTNDKKSSK